jgi:methylated-DNA-[protein]-cysteine S-methyltransferase
MKSIFYYQTDLGHIGIAEEDNKITNVFLKPDICQMQDADLNKYSDLKDSTEQNSCVNSKNYCLKETDILKEAYSQLYEYLQGKRQVFSVPLAPYGTEFMKSVWKCLCDIPYGETKSYKDIAKAIGNEKACRAVGQANNRNRIPIFIPCHRVIGTNGSLIGYNSGLQVKKLLLEIEKQHGNI